MTSERQIHLNKEQIMLAIIDATDLPLPLQKHLSSCLECNREKRQIERQFEQLGQQAAASVPLPGHRIFLASGKNNHRGKWFLQLHSSLGVLTTALLIFCISWGAYLIRHTPDKDIHQSVLGTQEAEALFMEVNVLAENALPKVYLEFSRELEAESDSEDFYLDYIIPLTDGDSLSLKLDKKGAASC